MKGGKDEGELMEPLFPELHIIDADKGRPRAPPRNKMAYYHPYNMLRSNCLSEKFPVLRVSTYNACSGFVSQGSLNNVCIKYLKPVSQCSGIPRSVGVCSNISTPKNNGDQQTLLNLIRKPQPDMLQNPSFLRNDDSCQQKSSDWKKDITLQSFLRFPENLENLADDNACPKPRNEDKTSWDHADLTESEDKLYRGNRYSTAERSSSDAISSILKKRRFYEIEERDLPNDDKTSEKISAEFSPNLTPPDVIRVMGRELFFIARKTLVHQQQVFSFQIFELHRLVKVQKLISELPKTEHNINIDTFKPSNQFPKMKKFLRFDPLDTGQLTVPKLKVEMTNRGADSITKPTGLVPIHDASSWYLHHNQWLIPVRSPSDGLIYKPYSFPALGLMNPANVVTGDLRGSAGESIWASDPIEREALPLFPTTPSAGSSKDNDIDKLKVHAIKVVPRSSKIASESGKRIAQFILEERSRNSQLHA